MKLWTSTKQLGRKEFPVILNEIIRSDSEILLPEATLLVRGINSLCPLRNLDDKRRITWPEDRVVYRGSGIPIEILSFFVPEKRYRCPFFLSCSNSVSFTKKIYCSRAENRNLPPVLWIIHIDPKHCTHVNFIDQTSSFGEQEFLFPPYSAFEVLSVDLQQKPTSVDPIIVHIKAESDSPTTPLELPLCSWH